MEKPRELFSSFDEVLVRKLSHIETTWTMAFDWKEGDESKRKIMFDQAREELKSFLQDVGLFNEWNEFKLQKIGWDDFTLFEVKDDDDQIVMLSLGPDIRNEPIEWADPEWRIKNLRWLRHCQCKAFNEKLEHDNNFRKVYREKMTELTNILFDDGDDDE